MPLLTVAGSIPCSLSVRALLLSVHLPRWIHCLEISTEIDRITSKVPHKGLCAYCQLSFGTQVPKLMVLKLMEDDF